MKHVRTISRANISRAQQMPAGDIIAIVISILTALASVVDVIGPLFEDKQK